MNTPHNDRFGTLGDGELPRGGDELDVLLREWHEVNRAKAAAGRDRMLAALRAEDAALNNVAVVEPKPEVREGSGGDGWRLWRIAPLAAAAVLTLAVLAPFMLPQARDTMATAEAHNTVMVADGGRLEAYDDAGVALGACVLEHTDVTAEIGGPFARVTLTQRFHNPHSEPIEAVYTFPLSHRGAVDRMQMEIGDRVVVGEVKDRLEAVELYRAARDAGEVAAITEQERANIFTQSVANIEPGALIDVTLSYVETVERRGGEYVFEFPTVVSPRYVPGDASVDELAFALPEGLTRREGLVLLGPAKVEHTDRGPGFSRSDATPRGEVIAALLRTGVAIEEPAEKGPEGRWISLRVVYGDGTLEEGLVYPPSIGHIGGRWFYLRHPVVVEKFQDFGRRRGESQHEALNGSAEPGSAFAKDTDQVPDASRITPMPMLPGRRSGQDLSISVELDAAGAGIAGLSTPLHQTLRTDLTKRSDGLPTATRVALKKSATIPNRDFVLKWRQAEEGFIDQVLTHTSEKGNFFALVLRPPTADTRASRIARELVFIVDVSGSMDGEAHGAAAKVVERMIGALQPEDRFNVVTYSGGTRMLWTEGRPATNENITNALQMLSWGLFDGRSDMVTAIGQAIVGEGTFNDGVKRARMAVVLTDGLMGSEAAILDTVRRGRGATRVHCIGVGNSVNRSLIDAVALSGGGVSDYLLLDDSQDTSIGRIVQRIQSLVLTNVQLEFSEGLEVRELVPGSEHLPDVFDGTPLMVFGKYGKAGEGSVTIRGETASGPWSRTVALRLPENEPRHDAVATMWARGRIAQLEVMNIASGHPAVSPASEIREEIVRLGQRFGVVSSHTSFVAVDKLRVNVAGRPRLVAVPVERPVEMNLAAVFGETMPADAPRGERSIQRMVETVPPIVRVEESESTMTSDPSSATSVLNAEVGRKLEDAEIAASPPQLTTATAARGMSMPGAPAAPPTSSPAPSAPPVPAAMRDSGASPSPDAKAGATPSTRTGAAPSKSAAEDARTLSGSATAKRGEDPGRARNTPDKVGTNSSDLHAARSRQAVRTAVRGDREAAERTDGRSDDNLDASDFAGARFVNEHAPAAEPSRGQDADAPNELQQNTVVELGLPVTVQIAEPGKQSHVRAVVPVQQVARRIGQLAIENETEQARNLANDLNRVAPQYEVARGMWQALNEVKAPEEHRAKQVAMLAEQATQELLGAARRAELQRKVDPRLWFLAFGEGVMPRAGLDASLRLEMQACNNLVQPEARQIAAQAGVELKALREQSAFGAEAMTRAGYASDELEQGVVVTVLVSGTGEDVLSQLRSAGLEIEDVQPRANVVVGLIPTGRLAEFSLLECVRRVEPVPAE